MRPTPKQIIANRDLVVEALKKAGVEGAFEKVHAMTGYLIYYIEYQDMVASEKSNYASCCARIERSRKSKTTGPRVEQSRSSKSSVVSALKSRGGIKKRLDILEFRFKVVKKIVEDKLAKWPELDLPEKLSSKISNKNINNYHRKRIKTYRRSLKHIPGFFSF